MDGFDLLPDSLILQIFDSVSDVKTLIRCRAVSKRFNSLVPHTDSLLLTVDRVISSDSQDPQDDDVSSFLLTFLKSILTSLHDLVSPKPENPTRTRTQNSPAQILRCFHRVKHLHIDLPSGDLRLEKGTVLKWKAEFGKTLKSCVILGFRAATSGEAPPSPDVGDGGGGGDVDFAGGLKVRVVWTISALIAASARHYLLKEVLMEQRALESLVLRDREGEGTVVMGKEGLRECCCGGDVAAEAEEEEEEGWDRKRSRVPSVGMRMRHQPRLQLKGGVWVEGATLVVVRPTSLGGAADVEAEDGELALGAFGDGLYGEVVEKLLKDRSYLLEMNSF